MARVTIIPLCPPESTIIRYNAISFVPGLHSALTGNVKYCRTNSFSGENFTARYLHTILRGEHKARNGMALLIMKCAKLVIYVRMFNQA